MEAFRLEVDYQTMIDRYKYGKNNKEMIVLAKVNSEKQALGTT
jgi:hypothetical protein